MEQRHYSWSDVQQLALISVLQMQSCCEGPGEVQTPEGVNVCKHLYLLVSLQHSESEHKISAGSSAFPSKTNFTIYSTNNASQITNGSVVQISFLQVDFTGVAGIHLFFSVLPRTV